MRVPPWAHLVFAGLLVCAVVAGLWLKWSPAPRIDGSAGANVGIAAPESIDNLLARGTQAYDAGSHDAAIRPNARHGYASLSFASCELARHASYVAMRNDNG